MGILQPGTQKGSEYSYGRGRHKDPRSDFQSMRALPFPQGDDEMDLILEYNMQKRLDATNPQENIYPDMMFAKGNPDSQFGPQPALVQEPINRRRGAPARPFLRYGVARQD